MLKLIYVNVRSFFPPSHLFPLWKQNNNKQERKMIVEMGISGNRWIFGAFGRASWSVAWSGGECSSVRTLFFVKYRQSIRNRSKMGIYFVIINLPMEKRRLNWVKKCENSTRKFIDVHMFRVQMRAVQGAVFTSLLRFWKRTLRKNFKNLMTFF